MKTVYRGVEIVIGQGQCGGWNSTFKYNDEVETCVLNAPTADIARISTEYLVDYLKNKETKKQKREKK